MRTTLTLDDDIAHAAKALAYEENLSMGAVVSRLARQGLQAGATSYKRHKKHALPVFQVREQSSPITLEDIKRAEDEA